MSRYPDETTARFDQQFVETAAERNARLRDRRERHVLAAIEAHRAWDARRKVLLEAAAVFRELATDSDNDTLRAMKAVDLILALIGPEPTDG